MPQPIPERGSTFQLANAIVGNPVSAYHGARLVQDTAFLLSGNAQSITDSPLDSLSAGDVSVFYVRSYGIQALLVGVELLEADGASRITVTVTNNGSALTWIQANGLDGTLALQAPAATTTVPLFYWGIVDVTGLAVGTTYRLRFAWSATGGQLSRVVAREIPLAASAPEADPLTEPGVNAAWPARRPNVSARGTGLVNGGVSTAGAYGFIRLQDQLNYARARWSTFRQNVYFEDDTYAPQTASTVFANLTWANGGTYLPAWYTRARRLYGTTVGTAVAETARVYVRYKCTAASGATLRIISDGNNNDLALATAAGYTTLDAGTVTLKTSGTNQRVAIGINAKVLSAGTVYLPTICLYSEETP